MHQRPLGRTGLTVSALGFGCASYWGSPAFDEGAAVSLVRRAVELGVTLFDTGHSYSLGAAEPRLGRALEGLDADRLVIATKAGTFHAGGRRIARDFSPAAIAASAEVSLKRLGVERLGVLQLHGPGLAELTDELLATLEGLKRRGLVRAVGANSFDAPVLARVIAEPVFDVVMLDYNVLRPERAELAAAAAAAGKGVLAGMPLAMGHTGGLGFGGRRALWYWLRALKNHRGELARGRAFRFLHARSDVTGAQAALAYVLADPNVSSAVFGSTRTGHLEENLRAADLALAPDLEARIAEAQVRLGLAPRAPVNGPS